MRERVKVYLAAPYSNGDNLNEIHIAANMKVALSTAAQLVDSGFDVFCPHTSHYIAKERRTISYDRWMEWCLAWLPKCDCVLRLKGKSKGADRECLEAVNLSMPVYTSVKDLMEAKG